MPTYQGTMRQIKTASLETAAREAFPLPCFLWEGKMTNVERFFL